mmetsp:Transcript_121744/g.345080  ORF Transcript_121744/g.345080 Transcript_121744/m.345080 type:complete len:115 (-) Transcript_121744:60-404(-)
MQVGAIYPPSKRPRAPQHQAVDLQRVAAAATLLARARGVAVGMPGAPGGKGARPSQAPRAPGYPPTNAARTAAAFAMLRAGGRPPSMRPGFRPMMTMRPGVGPIVPPRTQFPRR